MLAALVNTRANVAFVTCRRVIEVSEAVTKHLCYDMITVDPFRTAEHPNERPTVSLCGPTRTVQHARIPSAPLTILSHSNPRLSHLSHLHPRTLRTLLITRDGCHGKKSVACPVFISRNET